MTDSRRVGLDGPSLGSTEGWAPKSGQSGTVVEAQV